MQQNSSIGKVWEIGTHTFFLVCVLSPLDFHPMVYFIIWEMHGFPHVFLICTKPIVWGEPGKLALILFPYYGWFFPVRFPSCGNFIAWEMHGFSYQISHSIRKVIKTHEMEKTWEFDSYTFSIKWVLFSIRFSSCGMLYHIGNPCQKVKHEA